MPKQPTDLRQTLTHIEATLNDPLSVEALAGLSYFSRTHYQRLFRSLVGEPVMEYIKKRRLQQACRTLTETDATVLDIAISHGYDSYEGFSRAFKAYFGLSPKQFRKTGYKKEEKIMLSNELKQGITKTKTNLTAQLAPITTAFTELAALAKEAGKTAGNSGATTVVLAEEYGSLAKRIEMFVKIINDFAAEEATVFTMADTLTHIAKGMDDITMQTNLLRFFSAMETARIAVTTPKAFADIDNKLGEILTQTTQSRQAVTEISKTFMQSVRVEIKNDASAQLDNAINLLQKTASQATVAAADAKAAALSMGENGNAFACIANEAEKHTQTIKKTAEVLTQLKAQPDNPPPFEEINATLQNLQTTAFHANINTFNATIETARSGHNEALVKATKQLEKQPAAIQSALQTAIKTYEEVQKLTELLTQPQNKQEIPHDEKCKKAIEDILFQSNLLLAQARLETERCQHAPLRPLIQQAEAALSTFTTTLSDHPKSNKTAVKTYCTALRPTAEAYQKEAEAAETRGLVHKIITDELLRLTIKINAAYDHM